jgi:hypothetical protein
MRLTMKHTRRREATPVAHMILSKRMADHKAHDMICELVDNAFDADAKRVWIELGRRSLTVADDGSGMQDVNDAIRFGKGTRAGRRGGVLGRYGVGMTDALCKLGPKAEISTLRHGELRRLRVDWEECLRNDHFPYLDEGKPQRARELTVFETLHVGAGTRVHIHGQAPGIQLDRLHRILTERYTPGIWEGREIFIRREAQDWVVIEDMDPGPLSDVIEYDGEIDGLRRGERPARAAPGHRALRRPGASGARALRLVLRSRRPAGGCTRERIEPADRGCRSTSSASGSTRGAACPHDGES